MKSLILAKISHVTKDKDFKSISRLVFNNLNRFVINNQYNSENVLRVSKIYSPYSVFDDFIQLTEHVSSVKISSYLVSILKSKADSFLTRTVIEYIVNEHPGNRNGVQPAFIASACELTEFNEYLSVFIPILKDMFISESVEKREISDRAISQILSHNKENSIVSSALNNFVVQCAICEYFAVRLLCLDITQHLPILFILRNDIHYW